jgi:hypothetical protein
MTSRFQQFINVLVLVMAVGWIMCLAWLIWPTIEDYYAVLPDEVEALDAMIADVMTDVPAIETLVPSEYVSTLTDIEYNTALPTDTLTPQQLFNQTKASNWRKRYHSHQLPRHRRRGKNCGDIC